MFGCKPQGNYDGRGDVTDGVPLCFDANQVATIHLSNIRFQYHHLFKILEILDEWAFAKRILN